MANYTFDIIVYGGDINAVAAAAKAAKEGANKKVAIIVPEVRRDGKQWYGGIMTNGGLNYWDDKYRSTAYSNYLLTHESLLQKGSHYWIKKDMGPGFDVAALATRLKKSITDANVTEFYSYDISSISTANPPFRITSVTIKSLTRDSLGYVRWGSATHTLTGKVFIDASQSGRIARMVNTSVTTGRFDWPTGYLDSLDNTIAYTGRQQAATLMLKMKGIKLETVPVALKDGDFSLEGYYDKNGPYASDKKVAAFWWGTKTYKNTTGSTPKIQAFNNKYSSSGYMIKPPNGARNGNNNDEFWLNCFLIFNVDARAYERDNGTETKSFYPAMLNGYKNVDRAWVEAKAFVEAHRTEIRDALREMPGFANAEFCTDNSGVTVGDTLYLRESVHMAKNSTGRKHGSEDNYAITKNMVQKSGYDSSNYATRIGVGLYECDLHPFVPSQVKNQYGQYIWGLDSYKVIRSDAKNPDGSCYIPYDVLTTSYVANLLIPGYAASISSYAWGEMRVFPTLTVLGDAAGITAGYCVNNNKQPYILAQTDITTIQNSLIRATANLSK